ncbi:hypothetical protein [Amorphus orientalis]|uniref:Uncharacterized protein n=1 Tax=Amorphus orientalis TaxID=649198 RepID=A0AAE3VRZ5_9HYPH|nr:hypothetical protein [Amorphus orientalis]MDQ0317078.1 hypothetical protein [Amorphus orientalis]
MLIKKSLIIVATTLAVAGGSLTANAAPTAGSLAGAKRAVETTTIAIKKGKHPGKHHKYHGHGRGPAFHGHWGPGYVGFYPPRRCRIQRVKVYDPYLGRRVWVRERVCFRGY